MIQQTVLDFKLGKTDETLTAHGGLALMAEYSRGLGLGALVDRYLPKPKSPRGYAPSVFVESLVMMLQGGGQTLEDLRELRREEGLMKLLGCSVLPDPDTVGDWLRRMGGRVLRLVKNICGLDRGREAARAYDIALFPAF